MFWRDIIHSRRRHQNELVYPAGNESGFCMLRMLDDSIAMDWDRGLVTDGQTELRKYAWAILHRTGKD